MEATQAEALVGDLIRRYPGRDMPDSSVDVFVRTALSFTFEEGQRAVERVARHSPMFMPSWGQWEQALLAESHDRRDGDRTAKRLVAGGEPLLSPAELARRVGQLREKLADFGKLPPPIPGEDEEPKHVEYAEIVIATPNEGDFCRCGGTIGESGACRLCGNPRQREPATAGKEG